MPDVVIDGSWTSAVESLQPLATPPGWLRAAADADRVANALRARVPEFSSGTLALKDCEVVRVRIKDDSSWALYRLTVGSADGNSERAVELLGELFPPHSAEPDGAGAPGSFGTPAWRCYVPELRLALTTTPPDTALPAVPALVEPERARDLLERAIRESSPPYAELRIEACKPLVARYKRGSRCTVLYRLQLPPEQRDRGWPTTVVAKTYHGEKGSNAYKGMLALWNSELSRTVNLAEPLAFLPELNVLLQAGIPGDRTLEELIRSALATGTAAAIDELRFYLEKTAVGLAALHTCGASASTAVTWDDELAEIREVIERLRAATPKLTDVASPLLERLEALAAANPPDREVPSHRSFRPAQILLHDGEIGFIDFDGFCRAEPALDVALFRAIVRDVGARTLQRSDGRSAPGEVTRMDELCELFLARYEEVAPVSPLRVALWEALDLLTAVLHCWTKVKFDRLDYRLQLLSHHLQSSELARTAT